MAPWRASCGAMSKLACAALLAAAAAGCGGGGGSGGSGDHGRGAPLAAGDTLAEDRPLRVTATTSMVADLARQIGGDLVLVSGLMGPGVDPHLYKASAGDVRRLDQADVILYSGLHLEARMGDVLARLAQRRRTVAVAEAVPPSRLLSPPQFSGAPDPHVWFDVSLWRLAALRTRDAFQAADPARAAAYQARADRYLAELDSLDAYVRARAAELPPARRVLITAHDAFNYFGRAYGFEVRGLQGISTLGEAGTADVQELAAFIAERRLPAMFVESSVPRRAIEAVQAAVRARGLMVRIGGELYSDALGSPGTPAGDYLGMVRHNIDAIVAGLAGEAEGEQLP